MSEPLVRAILEQIAAGKLDKSAGVELLKRLKSEERRGEKDDIAIIGIAARLPDADNSEQFWANLRNGKESIGPFPEERRKDVDRLKQFTYMKDMEDVSYSQAGYLDRIDDFDYKFFGISPKEASLMDPNQRLFLQVAWHALEDAGYGERNLTGTRTGLYIGYSSWPAYGHFVSYTEPESFDMSVAGNISAIIASRIPHLLDLKGPSMLVDTACSSSLVALHIACKAIAAGDCEQALVGGLRLTLLPLEGYVKYGIEATDSRSKAFDDQADGTSLSEGVVTVFIKPLQKAISDGDLIYAVIKGSAINQDGNSINITAPNAKAQEDVIVRAWKDAGIDPETISYIEAHGTGTKLGDPIEIDGIQKAFRRYTDRKQFCAIGSLKSNIGHTDAAAGLASLIKAALALHRREIPPTLHFGFPNRQIAFEKSPVFVNDRLTPWEQGASPRRCGVSSFGFSGTNCHVVLEEAPAVLAEPASAVMPNGSYRLFTVSAKNEHSLQQLLDGYADLLEQNSGIDIDELVFSSAVGRGHYLHRIAAWARSVSELSETLREYRRQGGLSGQEERILYGVHRVVASSRKRAADTDVTESEIRERSDQAQQLLTEMQAADREPTLADLKQLAGLYISGANIDWDAAYQGRNIRKVRIPVYPFEKSRCWLKVPQSAESKPNRKVLFTDSDYYRHVFGKPATRIALSAGEPVASGYSSERIEIAADESLYSAVGNLAKSCGTSLSDVVLAVYQILLSRYSSSGDIVVGVLSPAAPAGVPIRVAPAGHKTFEYFVSELAEMAAIAVGYAQEAAKHWRAMTTERKDAEDGLLYQAVFAVESVPPKQVEPLPAELALYFNERENSFRMTLAYRTGSFDAGLSSRFASDFLHLLREAAGHKEIQLQSLYLPMDDAALEPSLPEEFAIDF